MKPRITQRGGAAPEVAQTSKSAVSRVSKPADRTASGATPIWKSAIQQVWKPLHPGSARFRISDFGFVSDFDIRISDL
jgi:hypothetical protein